MQYDKKKKEIKGIYVGTEEINLLTDVVVIYAENLKGLTKIS